MSWHGPRRGQRLPMHERKLRNIRRMAVAEYPDDWKVIAIDRCRIVADEFDEDFPAEVGALRERVDAWEDADGIAPEEGWVVYHRLGRLKEASGEHLFRQPESLILDIITSQPLDVHREPQGPE
jgi:hypothetical protein